MGHFDLELADLFMDVAEALGIDMDHLIHEILSHSSPRVSAQVGQFDFQLFGILKFVTFSC